MFEELGGPNQIVLADRPAAMDFRISDIVTHPISHPPMNPTNIDKGRMCSDKNDLRPVPLATSFPHQPQR